MQERTQESHLRLVVDNTLKENSCNVDYQKIMDKYHRGFRNEAECEICDSLNGYLNNLIRRHKVPIYLREDAMQEARLAIIENIKKYDPKIARATTFFRPYVEYRIMHYTKKFLNQVSDYYQKQIDNTKKAYIKAKSNQKILSMNEIIEITGRKRKSAIDIIEQIERAEKTFSLDSDNSLDIPDKQSLEEVVLKDIEREDIILAINKLSNKQKNIIRKKFGFFDGQCHTYKQLSDEYHLSPVEMKRYVEKLLLFIKFFMEEDQDNRKIIS